MFLLLVINFVMLGPAVFSVYFSHEVSTASKLVDVDTINQAITILNE